MNEFDARHNYLILMRKEPNGSTCIRVEDKRDGTLVVERTAFGFEEALFARVQDAKAVRPEVDAPQVSGVPMESLKAATDRIAKSPVYGTPRRCLRYDKVGTPLQVCGGDGDWCLAEDVAALEAELVAMTAARDYEKAAHQRTIDYHASKATSSPLAARGLPASGLPTCVSTFCQTHETCLATGRCINATPVVSRV